MEALYLLVPLSVCIVFVAIWVFFIMCDSGQFDDMVSPAWRILQDDDRSALEQRTETTPETKPETVAFSSSCPADDRSNLLPRPPVQDCA